jgi:hypothetical protein
VSHIETTFPNVSIDIKTSLLTSFPWNSEKAYHCSILRFLWIHIGRLLPPYRVDNNLPPCVLCHQKNDAQHTFECYYSTFGVPWLSITISRAIPKVARLIALRALSELPPCLVALGFVAIKPNQHPQIKPLVLQAAWASVQSGYLLWTRRSAFIQDFFKFPPSVRTLLLSSQRKNIASFPCPQCKETTLKSDCCQGHGRSQHRSTAMQNFLSAIGLPSPNSVNKHYSSVPLKKAPPTAPQTTEAPQEYANRCISARSTILW